MVNSKKIAVDSMVERLRSQTDYAITRFHKPSSAEAMYQYLTGGVSAGVDTVLVSNGAMNFTSIDTIGTSYNAILTVELFLVSNNIRNAQIEDVARQTDAVFENVSGALKDYFFEIDGVEYNFVLQSLNELFYDDGIDAQQLVVEVQGINIEL